MAPLDCEVSVNWAGWFRQRFSVVKPASGVDTTVTTRVAESETGVPPTRVVTFSLTRKVPGWVKV
ncbi:MAG: hypothetical protein IPH45_21720 [Bacteroidales bacterium]|nr:hypothetical protein [Bacteroidales bacterium]